jgi:hypothetical protein
MLAGKADPNANQGANLSFKFDNSKSMGDAASNSMSHALPRQENTIYLQAPLKDEGASQKCNLTDLWE